MTASSTSTGPIVTGERADLLDTLAKHRYFLTHTVRDLTDEQARLTPTVSALSPGGLIKHVTAIEAQWADFIVRGDAAMPSVEDFSSFDVTEFENGFRMLPDETLAGLLSRYAEVSAATDALVTGLPDLDASHPLPKAPWFEPGAVWSARRVLLHIVAETAQHAGHADILRESIDGAKSMG